MTELFTVEQTYSPKMRVQLSEADKVIGINADFLLWMIKYFVTRGRADRRRGRIYAMAAEAD